MQLILGQRVGHWKIKSLKYYSPDESKPMCLVLCVCGSIKAKLIEDIESGKSSHCGCKDPILPTPKKQRITMESGGEVKSLSEWSKVVGIKRQTLYSRFRAGWTTEEALSTPVRAYTRKNLTEAVQIAA